MGNITKKIFGMAVVFSLLVMTFTGCGGIMGSPKPGEKQNLVLIIGNHANAASLHLADLKQQLQDACLSCGRISILALDGEPYLVDALDIPEQVKGLSEKKKKTIAEQQAEQILAIAGQAQPKSEEVDTLKAIQMAAHQLEGAEGNKYILIADSGLATTGIVNFCDLRLEADQSDKIVEGLEAEAAIPNLNGVKVTWYGMGQVSSPQQDLYEKHRSNLVETWSAILQTAGASDIEIDSTLALENNADADLPKVSVVPVNQPASLVSSGEIKLSDPERKEVIWECNEEEIAFQPGSEKLLSTEKAVLKVLQGFIDDLVANPDLKILLAGTTASAGTEKELLDLSLRRTATIKNLLVKHGVKPSQITVAGLGYDNAYTIKDTDKNGFCENKGKKNRKVLIMNADSSTAKQILKGGTGAK